MNKAGVKKNVGRRLLKGAGFFGSYGDEGEWEGGGCFGKNNSVVDARSMQKTKIGGLEVGDRLVTTVPDDEVWYLHTSEGLAPMLKIMLSGGSVVTATPHHLLLSSQGMKPASTVQLGDMLATRAGNTAAMREVILFLCLYRVVIIVSMLCSCCLRVS